MQIYVMNADGSGQTRLTSDGSNNDNPRWSPNGTKILFQSDRDNPGSGLYEIYVMNADGSGQTRLTTDANDDCNASWSGDGTKIVFQSLRNGLYYQIYTMNADGSGQTNIGNTAANDMQPSWSPDGAKVAFASDRDQVGLPSVYVMNANGSNQTRLTFSGTGLRDEQPAWSPNATKIAFTSTRDSVTESWTETDDYEIPEDDGQTFPKSRLNINKEVYVMNADGTGQTRLTNSLGNDDAARWSPDGTKIVFRSERERDLFDPTPQIWTMNADGTNQTNLSNSGDADSSPSWASGSANQSPVANAGGPYSGVVSQNAPFSGSGSYDPDGSIVSYSWTFGDGGTGSGVAPYHAYATTGTFTVNLTVTDNLGAQGSATTTINISASSSDQYATSFLQWGLGRAPNGDESSYWTDIFRAAYPKGLSSMKLATRELGMTVFESAEYAARNRNDHWYVYDLYKTFLMRDPDADGWAYWEAAIPIYGRDQIRRGFDESTEFANIVATLNASGSPSANVSSLATARVDLFNQAGNRLQARDAEWSVSLLSLPGRAGLDLGLGLSYSSLVWTRSGPYSYFDADGGSPSPGFHIGFPTIQDKYFDAQVGANVYLLKTAAGRTIELRQVGTSNTYESADSSYLQLTTGGSLLLGTTDGTMLNFAATGLNEYRCTWIRDRNGNYMIVNYDWRGDIQNITDTLSRVITFNYDPNANLNSITQSWNGQTHTWATFGWENLTMQPTVTGVVGTYSGEIVPVLKMVGFHNSTYTKFLYNGNGQVRQITSYASDSNPATDNHPRNYTIFHYDSATNDCPRLNLTRTWAEYWTGLNGVPNEVTTQFGVEGDKHTLTVLGDPTGTIFKESYAGTGAPAWQRGLVLGSEVWASGSQQKVSTLAWTQDNTNVNYKTNPRATQTVVSDGANVRKTTVGYTSFTLPVSGASCSLPNEVYEYAADQTTIMRRTHTDYVIDVNYLNNRIIGLPDKKLLYEGTSTLMTKMSFVYDLSGEYLQGLPTAPVQHDGYYSTDFTVGRGNLVKVLRWDVNDPDNQTKVTETKAGYDITGNVIFTRDALNHQTTISYSDVFSADGTNLDPPRSFATFAYPTTLTDADGFSSTVRYKYEVGAKTRVEGPPPQNQPNGAIQTFTYDSAARLERVTTQNNGAYTHYVYGSNYVQSYSSVNNVAANYSDSDSYAITVFDGVGRGFTTTTNHPGSTGGYKLVNVIFDRMGRPFLQSNPTEVNSSWLPAGDDADGVHYSLITFDWKGRTLRTTHPDGTYTEASYLGCGCAGGEVVTLTDEGTTVPDGTVKVRQQKIYADVLGRQWKTEILNWDGPGQYAMGGSVYSTTVNIYNARDQVKISNQYAGAAPSDASSTNENVSCPTGSCQKTSMSFEGYGRLQSKHLPEQDAGTATVWEYNNDDTVHKVTDARGASATYTYNNGRHLVNLISYDPGNSGAPDTSDALFEYDAVGNRTLMNDGLGNQSYAYDSLSRMTSETRTFNGVGSFTLSYDYNLAGELKKVTDPTNMTINYGFDSGGRLSNVTGSDNLYAGVSNYASNFQYRAWGAVRHLNYGNGRTMEMQFNSRMQATRFEVPGVFGLEYQYTSTGSANNDGRIKFARDLTQTNSQFDRAYSYDHLGRLAIATSGTEARGGTMADGPYNQTYSYDPFNNSTGRTNRLWSDQFDDAMNINPATNRNAAWTYDADGRVINEEGRNFTFDAAGRWVTMTDQVQRRFGTFNRTQLRGYDGNGLRVKESKNSSVTYQIRSTVLKGNIVMEINASGQKQLTNIYAGGALLAKQQNNEVVWQHGDPLSTQKWTSSSSNVNWGVPLDPLGANVRWVPPFEPADNTPEQIYSPYGDPTVFSGGILLDGAEVPMVFISMILNFGNGHAGHEAQANGKGGGQYADSIQFVEAWEEYFIPGSNNPTYDAKGNPIYSGGTTGIRNVGYFVTVPGGGALMNGLQLREPRQQLRPFNSDEISSFRNQLKDIYRGKCKELLDGIMNNIGGVFSSNITDIYNWMADHGTLMRDDFLQDSAGRSIRGSGGGNAVDEKPISAGVTLNFTFGSTVIFALVHEATHANGGAGSQSISHEVMAQAAISAAASANIDLQRYQNGPSSDLKLVVWAPDVPGADIHNANVFQFIVETTCGPYVRK